jgi:hypothetical protein
MAAIDLFDELVGYLEALPFSLPVRTKTDLIQVDKYLSECSGNKERLVDFLVAVARVSSFSDLLAQGERQN